MREGWNSIKRYSTSLACVVAVTLFLAPLQGIVNSTTVALSFLIAILIIATLLGTRPAYFASVLAVLSFNFFFLPPLHTFTISDPQNWIALVAFLATSIIAGKLSSYARRRASESEERRAEIERLYDELQNAFEKASQAEAFKQSEQLKSALLDAVTHDLRTPLTSIKASVTTLIEGFNRDPQRGIILAEADQLALLALINDETDRLNSFIGGIVDLARIEAGKAESQKNWTELGGILEASIERCSGRLNDHVLTMDIENELPSVYVAADAIGEIIYLYLDNAAKYSPPGSAIRVTAVRSEGETIRIVVEDQGRGIEPASREKVFEKFYRGTTEEIHSTGGGLGVGLAIVKGIAESQDGKAWAEDGEGDFTTKFVFQFPVGDYEQQGNFESKIR